MRLIVIAKDRAPTIATMIHAICCQVGHAGPPLFACTVRAASSAAVNANGRAKIECSNLIISSTVRMRLVVILNFCSTLRGRGISRRLPSEIVFPAADQFARARGKQIVRRDRLSFAANNKMRARRASSRRRLLERAAYFADARGLAAFPANTKAVGGAPSDKHPRRARANHR